MENVWDDEAPSAPVVASWDDEAEVEDAKELTELLGDPASPPAVIVQKRRTDARYKQLAADVRALPPRQRMFLKCLVANAMIPVRAIKALDKALKEMGSGKADRSTCYRWLRDPDFKALITLYSDLALEVHGLNNPTTTMLRIDEVYEEAMTPQPIVSRKSGQVVGYKKDLSSALKATDQLGRAQKLFRAEDEKSQRVTVVLDFSGEKPAGSAESEVIDGEFEEK